MKRYVFLTVVCIVVLKLVTPQIAHAYLPADVPADVEQDAWNEFQEERAKAVVLHVDTKVLNDEQNFITEIDYVKVKVLKGRYKDEIFTVENPRSGNPVYDIQVAKGDKVNLLLEVSNDQIIGAYIEDYYRLDSLLGLSILFVLAVLVLGRWQGLRALLTLVFTVGLIVKVLLPLAIKGYSPLLLAVGIAVLAIVVTLLAVGGVSYKSLHAILGTTGGVLVSALLAIVFGKAGHLTGLSASEAQLLLYAPQGAQYNFQGLLFAGIMIGALGAVMDVGMSIASAMHELRIASPDISRWQLLCAGLNVGRDIMGTMTNTLILAYAGSSLPLLMLFMIHSTDLSKILNLDLFAAEIVRSLAGSIGLICCIPLTAVAAVLITADNPETTASAGDE